MLQVNNPPDAANVGYLPPWTDAVEQPASVRLQSVISIRDFQVDGTGASDDTAPFTNAVAWAMLSGQALELVDGDTYALDTWAPIAQTGPLVIVCKGRATIKGPAVKVDFVNPDGDDVLIDGLGFERWLKAVHNEAIASTIDNFIVRNCHFDDVLSTVWVNGPIARCSIEGNTFGTCTFLGIFAKCDQSVNKHIAIKNNHGDVVGSAEVLGGQVFFILAEGRNVQIIGNSVNDVFGNTSTAFVQPLYTKSVNCIVANNNIRIQTSTPSATVEGWANKGNPAAGPAPLGIFNLCVNNVLEGVEGTAFGVHVEDLLIDGNIVTGFDKGVNGSNDLSRCMITNNQFTGNDKSIAGNDAVNFSLGTAAELIVIRGNTFKTFKRGVDFSGITTVGNSEIKDNRFHDMGEIGIFLPTTGTFSGLDILNNRQDGGTRFFYLGGATIDDLVIKGNRYRGLTDNPDLWITMVPASAPSTCEIADNGPILITTAAGGSNNVFKCPLPDLTTGYVDVEVVAVKSDGSERAVYRKSGLFYRSGAGAVAQGATDVALEIESDATWDCFFDVSGNDIRFRVTGIAATTINWSVRYSFRTVH